MRISVSQLRNIIKEEIDAVDPRLLSSRVLTLVGSLTNASVAVEEELSAIESSIKPLSSVSDSGVSDLIHETVVALSNIREQLKSLKSVAEKAKQLSPHK